MPNDFVTLVSYQYPNEAFFLMAKLEEHGILSHTGDETTIATNPLLSNAIGGVKVKVREEDLEEARRILEAFEAEKKESREGKQTSPGKNYTKVSEFCPQCESSNVYQKKGAFLSFTKEYLCVDCNHRWKN